MRAFYSSAWGLFSSLLVVSPSWSQTGPWQHVESWSPPGSWPQSEPWHHRVSSVYPEPSGQPGNWQHGGLAYPRQRGPGYDYTGFIQDQNARAEAVIDMFRFAWDGYYTYAYPHDDLLPKNNSFSDSRNGWGLLMVDSLDTAIIMEQEDIVNIILDYIPTIDFTKNHADPNGNPPNLVSTSLFESNIRYLGGLLGAYDLLKGPFAHLSCPEGSVDALLAQAQSLADTLKFAFDTPTGIPVNLVYVDNQTFTTDNIMEDGTYWADLAEFGTLVLEW